MLHAIYRLYQVLEVPERDSRHHSFSDLGLCYPQQHNSQVRVVYCGGGGGNRAGNGSFRSDSSEPCPIKDGGSIRGKSLPLPVV